MKKILVIEDNLEVRENIVEILSLSNFKVVEAENGKQGVELAMQELPDLIVCDIMMPVLDGYGVLHMLSRNATTASIPFIFLTAKSEKSDFRKGMESGADDYLTKPFDGSELLNAIDTRFKKAALLEQKFTNDQSGINKFISHAKKDANIELTGPDRETYSFRKKQLLYKEGQKPIQIYFIIDGKVKIAKTNEYGKELITNILGPGDFFGYMPILEEKNYSDMAEVLEDAELMVIPKSDFLKLINENNQIARQFIKLLTQNITEKEESLLNIAYNSLRKKVSMGLLQVYDKFGGDVNDKLNIDISRENLSHVIGVATESLIRTLGDFKSEKLIDIREGKIYILDENKLRNLVN